MPNGVRRARMTDLTTVGVLQWASWIERDPAGAEATGLDPAGIAGLWRTAILDAQADFDRLLVATDADDDVVGFAVTARAVDPDAGPESAELTDLVVAADRRGRGHGSRLLAAAAQTMEEAGARELVAWVDDGAPLEAFLASAGFTPDGAVRELASGAGSRAQQLRMTASIDGAPRPAG